jgi:hypothetical protein
MEDGTVLRIFTFEDCSGTLLLTEEEYHQALLSMDEEYPQEKRESEVSDSYYLGNTGSGCAIER